MHLRKRVPTMRPEREFDMILDWCMDALQRGIPIDTILKRYPEEADKLLPLLKTAQFVIQTPAPRPPENAIIDSKAKMLQVLTERQVTSERQKITVMEDLGMGFQKNWGKGLIIVIFSFVLIFILLSSVCVSAAESLPGNQLYPVKLALQDLRLMLTFDPVEKQERYAYYCWVRQQDLLAAIELERISEADAQATLTAMPTLAPTWSTGE